MNLRAMFSDRVPAAVKPSLATLVTVGLLASAPSLGGCGGDEVKYTARSAPTGKPAAIPAPPTLPNKKKKDGDAYTIFGASHDLRSKVHQSEVNDKKISLVGYIVKTNLIECKDDSKAIEENCTPKCAVHKGGKGDDAECKAPVPTFFIADEKDSKGDEVIAVMGWASNYAKIYDAIEEFDKAPSLEKQKEIKVDDAVWGSTIPNPLPAVGAKVKVTGTYAVTFTKATGGAASNPKFGIMTSETIEYLEPAPELANLPSLKERKKLKDK